MIVIDKKKKSTDLNHQQGIYKINSQLESPTLFLVESAARFVSKPYYQTIYVKSL